MATKITVSNTFHNTTATFMVRDDRTISVSTYRRVRKTLCPHYPTCRCNTDYAIGFAEPIYRGAKDRVNPHAIESYKIPADALLGA